MFARLLRETREEAGITAAELADRSGTSRAAIADYEAGRKNPRTDTAERLLNAMGSTLTVAHLPRTTQRAIYDRSDLTVLFSTPPSSYNYAMEAKELTAEIIEADCAIDGIEISWGEVKALAEGISIGGDPLRTWRATEISRSLRAAITRGATGRRVPLRTVVRDTLIEEDPHARPGEREIDYLVTSIAAGADPVLTLHSVSSALLAQDMPWLCVRFREVEAYRRALVRAKRAGDGTEIVQLLMYDLATRNR